MNDPASALDQLLALSHDLGREDRDLTILGEGNTSVRTGPDSFLVKASGSHLGTLTAAQATSCRIAPLVALMDNAALDDTAVDEALLAARTDPAARKPSVEAMFHAWLLTLPGIHFVGHTHPSAVNSLLCSTYAETYARQRLFPDEVVCCGPESVLVPYVDPGLALARAIRDAVKTSIASTGIVPRILLLKNHGLIALGSSPAGVLAATLMAVKAARITLGAIAAGGPVPMSRADIVRIAGRSDEHYRQRALGL